MDFSFCFVPVSAMLFPWISAPMFGPVVHFPLPALLSPLRCFCACHLFPDSLQ